MADKDPWDQFQDASQSSGLKLIVPPSPNIPTPQTPLQQEATRTSIEQNKTSIANTSFDNTSKLRGEFNALPEVKNYKDALGSLTGAMRAPDTAQGDLAVVYSFAKAMDPGSVVREGEMDMANATSSQAQQVNQMIQSITAGKRLPPSVRVGLIEAARQKIAGLRPLYDQQYQRYSQLARDNRFDPAQVVGEPAYKAAQPIEEAYIRAHGGTPRGPDGQMPDEVGATTVGDLNINLPRQAQAPKAFHDGLYATMVSMGHAGTLTPEAVDTWVSQYNQAHGTSFGPLNWNDPSTKQALMAAQKGKPFGVETPKDPRVQIEVNRQKQTGTGADAAINVGAQSGVTAGMAPRIAAFGSALRGSLTGDGSFGDLYDVHLDANRQYIDELRAEHPYAFTGGEIGGSLLLPGMGARSPAELAALGGGYGSVYGASQGDSSTGIGGRIENTLMGGATGAATGYLLPKGLERIGRFWRRGEQEAVPPLVDPASGELNDVLDAAGPTARYQALQDAGISNPPMSAVGGRSARVIEGGLNNLPGSAGVMEDAATAVGKDARNAMENVASQFGDARSLYDAGTSAQRGANSWMSRFDALASKAYDAIPIGAASPATLTNTRAKLADLLDIFRSNPKMKQMFQNSRLRSYLDALTPEEIKHDVTMSAGAVHYRGPPSGVSEEGGTLSWDDLKHFRSILGEDLGEQRLGGDSPYKSQLKALYGALSEDMRATASAQGPKALKAFERANTLYRQGQERIDGALTSILGNDAKNNPENAAAIIQKIAQSGRGSGNLKQLSDIRASLQKTGDWDDVASALIRMGGLPSGKEGRAFDPGRFVDWYSGMTEPARNLLFSGTRGKQLRGALDNFVQVSQQLAKVRKLTNTSNTTPTIIGSGFVGAAGAAAILHPLALVGLAGEALGNYGMAKLWTSPKFVQWATGYGKVAAAASRSGKVDPGAVSRQIRLLTKVAATEPGLTPEINAIRSILSNGANDNVRVVSGAAAGTDPNSDQQNQ